MFYYKHDPTLNKLILRSFDFFQKLYDKNPNRWVITYSGGKDSTVLTILVLEFLKNHNTKDLTVDVVYSDTLVEIPPLHRIALNFLDYIEVCSNENNLKINTYHVTPPPEERFWVKVLGKGYPPPRPRFRWCTDRLKIRPTKPIIFEGKKPVTILTGVRFDESSGRKARMTASCKGQSECGQGFWFLRGPKGKGISYAAPIAEWTTCQIWDFLYIVAPELGYPTRELFSLYGGDGIRFGCWTCTLVKEDKAMQHLINNYDKDSELLIKLLKLRGYLDKESRKIENRVIRPDGRPGKLRFEFRKKLLNKILEIESDEFTIISDEDLVTIKKYWIEEEEQC